MKLEEEVQGKVDALLTMVCVRKTDPDAYDFVLKELTRMAILGTLPPGSRLRNSMSCTEKAESDASSTSFSEEKERFIAP